MFRQRRIIPLAAFAITLTMTLIPARAGSVSAGGWNASWDDAFDPVLGLTPLKVNSNSVSFNKFAQFTAPPDEDLFIEPLVITFQQTSFDAKRFIKIVQESVINQTGADWVGFDFIIAPPFSGMRFDANLTFATDDPFSIDPFTNHVLSGDGKTLSLWGGVVPASPIGENVWNPGQLSGALWIDAAPVSSGVMRGFELKEAPTVVPLPPGALTGLMGLVGIAGVNVVRRIRRRSV